MYFVYNNDRYTYTTYKDFNTSMLPKRKTYKQSKFIDLGCAFDIETSKIQDEKLAFMYVWQFAINDLTIIGRTWPEFIELLETLADFYKLNKKIKLLVYVHNLSYEFSFIKNWIQWEKRGIFAMDKRTIVKATTANGIEFRDSMLLTNMSLEKLATNFNTGLKKLKGDLDYNIIRYADTPLSNEELAYCINDVQILTRFYHSYIKPDFIEKQLKIPLTSTGVVRDELKRNFKKIPKKEKARILRELSQAMPNEKEYNAMITWLYRGGYVHANVSIANKKLVCLDFRGMDEKSAYPAVALQEGLPYKFIERTPLWWEINHNNKKYLKNHSYYGTFKFYNIEAKGDHTLESKNKIYNIEGSCIWDNGRLKSCDGCITVVLNEYDMECYSLIYKWDRVECLSCYSAEKKPLPEYVKDLFLKYFSLKEELPDGYERNKVKAKVNSLYGMMVTRLYIMDYIFNSDLGIFEEAQTDKSYQQLVNDLILLPQWGIWITSINRQRVLKMATKCNEDDLYNDTDSCKIKNYIGNKWAFDCHNDRVRRINKNMYVGNYKRELFKDLGCFEDEGKMFIWKTNGSKRYIYGVYDKKKKRFVNKVTVAGMRKGSLEQYCEDNNLDIYEIFNDGLILDEEDSNKLTTAYTDVSFTREIEGRTIYEKSCVCLYGIPFSMKMSKEYINLIYFVQNRNSRDISIRRY